jgi:hypothetical protein
MYGKKTIQGRKIGKIYNRKVKRIEDDSEKCYSPERYGCQKGKQTIQGKVAEAQLDLILR